MFAYWFSERKKICWSFLVKTNRRAWHSFQFSQKSMAWAKEPPFVTFLNLKHFTVTRNLIGSMCNVITTNLVNWFWWNLVYSFFGSKARNAQVRFLNFGKIDLLGPKNGLLAYFFRFFGQVRNCPVTWFFNLFNMVFPLKLNIYSLSCAIESIFYVCLIFLLFF